MSEFRQDPFTGRWVIIGSERAHRPNEFVEADVREAQGPCPFCLGNERETPAALATYRTEPVTTVASPFAKASNGPKTSNGKGHPMSPPGESSASPWQVRVVPNKFPAVTLTNEPAGQHDDPQGFHILPGFGQHEVIIESPRHVVSLSELTVDEAWCVFRAYRDRLHALQKDGRFAYAQIFKNVGSAAGASIEHAHTQLIATPWVPDTILQKQAIAKKHFDQTGGCLSCSVLETELTSRQRIVASTDNFVAYCPWASAFAYELTIVPRRHQANFTTTQDSELGELARFVQDLVGGIEHALGTIAYNWFLHTEPFDTASPDHYHWHIEIIPRFTKVAGFELATGVYINSVAPETAADVLRSSLRLTLNNSQGCSV